ncbi:MAG: hypothetical protein KAJ42_03590 [Gemmatimonadetes bacterium]|nr:hypothetical protein [Gemmatimonadota bacterium]
MIGMDFVSFIILLVISVIVSAVLHYGLRYQVVPGLSSFFGKVVLGWLGAWLGTPVFGRWFAGVAYEEVYFIPAILGSLAMLVLVIDVVKTFTGGSEAGASAAETTTV